MDCIIPCLLHFASWAERCIYSRLLSVSVWSDLRPAVNDHSNAVVPRITALPGHFHPVRPSVRRR